jgi:hypothetical protein
LADVVGRQAVDPEQMAVREPGVGGASVHQPGTIGGGPQPRKMPLAKTSTGNIKKFVLREPASGIA